MNLRADHVAGGAFVAFGVLILALSGDLPLGRLSMPGAGFMPMLVAVLMIVLGLALALRARESGPLSDIDWSDLRHAGSVVVITAIGIALYEPLGFIITMIVLVLGLLLVIERRNIVYAGVYSVAVVMMAFVVFDKALKSPLPLSPFGFF